MAEEWNKRRRCWENTGDQRNLGDFKAEKGDEKMDRLLDAVNNGDLSWNELKGAKIVAVDERIVDDEYIVGLTVRIRNERYLWTIIGEIQKVI